MKHPLVLKFLNIWPPFLGAGIRVKNVNEDYTSIDVEMKLHFWNSNMVGTHYGGSLFSMTDAFYATILLQNLGPDYIVWDKSADIRFKKPGKGKVSAQFNISKERIAEIRKAADDEDKTEPQFKVEIRDEAGDVVAEVNRTLYVRRKDKPRKPK